jgi:hypothetical protein
MAERRSPTAVLREGPRALSDDQVREIEDSALTEVLHVDIDDVIEYVHKDLKSALHEGYDAQRTVMYRKIMLEEGDLLEFFKAIYFFVESLAIIGAVPATYPATIPSIASAR